jgi:hypothetical protein
MTTRVPVGSVVVKVYFRVPDGRGGGADYNTWEEVCDAALAVRNRRERLLGLVSGLHVVDERWQVRHPDGTVTDLLVQRTALGDALKGRSGGAGLAGA